MEYFKILNVVAEGDFVFLLSQGEFVGKPTQYADLFRLQNEKFVEHWDVMQEIPPSNKQIVMGAMNTMFIAKDPSKIDDFFSPEYIHHGVGHTAKGSERMKGLVKKVSEIKDFEYKNYRVFEDGDFVITHNTYKGLFSKPSVVFDLFRLENHKIVEHWDTIIPIYEKTESGRTQVDGPSEAKNLEFTEKNKKIAVEFINEVVIHHKKELMANYFEGNGSNYLQHNPEVADGLNGFYAFLKKK